MTYLKHRQMVKDAGIKLAKERLVQGTWGNISVRLDKENMLVTPSGLDYERMSLDDLVEVNIKTLEYNSNVKPTSEKKMHALILLNRPDINAVIHSHPQNSSAFAAARQDLPILSLQARSVLGDKVKVSGYGLPGTKRLTLNTLDALGSGNACIMANHGAIVCASNLDKAFEIMKLLEQCAKEYLEYKVMQLSGTSVYNRDDLFALFLKKH